MNSIQFSSYLYTMKWVKFPTKSLFIYIKIGPNYFNKFLWKPFKWSSLEFYFFKHLVSLADKKSNFYEKTIRKGKGAVVGVASILLKLIGPSADCRICRRRFRFQFGTCEIWFFLRRRYWWWWWGRWRWYRFFTVYFIQNVSSLKIDEISNKIDVIALFHRHV